MDSISSDPQRRQWTNPRPTSAPGGQGDASMIGMYGLAVSGNIQAVEGALHAGRKEKARYIDHQIELSDDHR